MSLFPLTGVSNRGQDTQMLKLSLPVVASLTIGCAWLVAGEDARLAAQNPPAPAQSSTSVLASSAPAQSSQLNQKPAATQSSAPASDAGNLQPQTPPHRSRKSYIDARVGILTRSLDLNDAQQSAVKNILEQRQQETLRIRHDPSISGSARIERFRALQDTTVERIRALLTDEQKKKYDPQASRQIQSKPERSVEDWLEATKPK